MKKRRTVPRKKLSPNRNSKQTPQQYITEWMKTFVEQPHPFLGGLPPCPYAQKARLDGKVKMIWVSNNEDDGNVFTHIAREDFKKIDVLILITDRKRWTWRYAYKLRCELNNIFAKDDKVMLEDHPDYGEKIGEIDMSNGRYCLMFAQKRSKLNRFSKILEKTTDYYKNWTQKELEDIVTWRFEDPK